MKLEELIDKLKELEDVCGPDVEVRLAMQPNWPLAFNVGNVTILDAEETEDGQENSIIWIAEGGHPYNAPYAPKEAWEDNCW